MKVLHVIPGIGRVGGGPSRSSQGLVAALCKAGVDAWIYSFDWVEPWIPGVRKAEIVVVGSRSRTVELKSFDLVHIHSIWDWRLHKIAVACRKAGVPYVIAPRGMLEPWSLKQGWLKKRIARWLYQDRDLRLAAALHATAESEAEQFRRLGFKNKIIISPNGVNVSDQAPSTKRQALGTDEKRRALFVSRMHPKKGVLELVESWHRVFHSHSSSPIPHPWLCELVYTVGGETEKAYEQKVKDRILALGMTYSEGANSTVDLDPRPRPDFILTGPLDDDAKWNAYARADLFVLPTYSENFGIVVAEALWAGVPVITTKGTPWKELEERKCGWWVALPSATIGGVGSRSRRGDSGGSVEWPALDNALKEAVSLHCTTTTPRIAPAAQLASLGGYSDYDSLPQMGQRGHELVEARYTWAAVCDKVVRGYEEVLNGWGDS